MKRDGPEPQHTDKGELRKRDRELLDACLERLQANLPIEAEVLEGTHQDGHAFGADFELEFQLDGVRETFAVETKGNVRPQLVPPLVHQAHRLADRGRKLLVCAERIPAAAGRELRDHGIAYLDRGGNAFLRAPGWLVYIEGRQVAQRQRTPRKHTETQIRLLGEFLKNPKAGELLQTDLASRAGVALGAIGKRREELVQLGILDRVDKRLWALRDREKGLLRFAEGWAARVRPGLRPRTYRYIDTKTRPTGFVPEDQAAQQGYLIGGERAAGTLTGYLRTEHTTLHVPPQNRNLLAKDLGLVPDPGGTITLLDRFGQGDELQQGDRDRRALAHPLLIWAECQMVPNHRVAEVAQQMYERLLEQPHD